MPSRFDWSQVTGPSLHKSPDNLHKTVFLGQSQTQIGVCSKRMTESTAATSAAVKDALDHSDTEGEHDIERPLRRFSTRTTDDQEASRGEAVEIANTESILVRYSRALMVGVLIAVATTVSIVAFLYSRNVEQDNFETYFYDTGNKVAAEFSGGASRRINAIESLANQFTSYAIDSNEAQWPNVALPDFERRATYTMGLSDVLSIIFFPIVTKETRHSWEAFSVENQGWLKEGLETQDVPEEEYNQEWIDILEETWGETPDLRIREEIFRLNGTGADDETGPGPYAPWWQFAPAFPTATLVNYNAYSHATRAEPLQSVIENAKPVVTMSWDYSDETAASTVGKKAALNLFLQHGGGHESYQAGPAADVYVPIFDSYGDNKHVVGELAAYIYWQVYFENILPKRDVGVHVVLENSCNQAYTYRIDGSQATYVGQGDLHDRQYSHLGVKTDFGSFIGLGETDQQPSGQCLYRVLVYPSKELEEVFRTNEPMYFALALAGTLLFTCCVFFLYDYLVERRQKVVMNTAKKTSAVVASLFPKEVRDRLYEKATPKPKEPQNTLLVVSGSRQIHNPIGPQMQEEADEVNQIADLYPECTVSFSDIVGFTRWSSSRQPKDVFKLLETLYKSFDRSANSLGVFKVETIGDCYVAVTGLPNPQEDHAVLMAKFASSCMLKLAKVTHHLVDQLGADTADLGLRIGMHSGPVTAGVLRGAKARFQLFGDTVNTAARMESTGSPMKTQVSTATAELLQMAGHGEWLQERDHEVEAKGKGKLKTYWLRSVQTDRSSSGPTTSTSTSASSDE